MKACLGPSQRTVDGCGSAHRAGDALEVAVQFLGGWIALAAVLFQAPADHVLESRWKSAARKRRFMVKDPVDGLYRAGTRKGPIAGGHLIKDDTEAEDIRTVIQLLT